MAPALWERERETRWSLGQKQRELCVCSKYWWWVAQSPDEMEREKKKKGPAPTNYTQGPPDKTVGASIYTPAHIGKERRRRREREKKREREGTFRLIGPAPLFQKPTAEWLRPSMALISQDWLRPAATEEKRKAILPSLHFGAAPEWKRLLAECWIASARRTDQQSLLALYYSGVLLPPAVCCGSFFFFLLVFPFLLLLLIRLPPTHHHHPLQ